MHSGGITAGVEFRLNAGAKQAAVINSQFAFYNRKEKAGTQKN